MTTTKKICVVGPSGSGKSRLVHELLMKQPSNIHQNPTLGVEVHPYCMKYGKNINIWDCAGKYFGDNPSKFYNECDLFIIVYPNYWVDNQKTMWQEYIKLASPNTKIHTCIYPNTDVIELANEIKALFN